MQYLARIYNSKSLAGEYVGLTGTRLDGAEMLACGLATHFVPSEVVMGFLSLGYNYKLKSLLSI